MGWTVAFDFEPRRKFIERITRTSVGSNGTKCECLKKVYRGPPFQGVLYALWQNTYPDGSVVKYAVVYLIRLCRPDGWGYNDMEASMGPYYYAFPLSWL